jgi:hypothetical protein
MTVKREPGGLNFTQPAGVCAHALRADSITIDSTARIFLFIGTSVEKFF